MSKTPGKRDPSSHRTPEQITKMNHTYDATPKQIKKRSMTNAARAMLAKEGLVHKGDGKDVDHKHMLKDGGGNARSNLRAIPQSVNRAWRSKK